MSEREFDVPSDPATPLLGKEQSAERQVAMDKVEDMRQIYIDGLDDAAPDWRKRYAPDTWGCHEALDRTSLIMGLVDDLSSHPGVLQREEWYRLASQAFDLLYALYQGIGAAHLNADSGREER